MKELKIEVPKGFEIDKEKSTFEKIVFKEIENKLPMSVEYLSRKQPYYYIDNNGEISITNGSVHHKNDLSTKERAEAFLALMQLVELRDAYNGDWKANWTTFEQDKYCIEYECDEITYLEVNTISKVLHFKSSKLRDQFTEQFKDLIETAKELL